MGDLLGSLVELEKTGHEFYQKMSQQIKDEKVSSLFRFLAGEEAKHEKIYTDLANELKQSAPVTEKVDPDYDAYLKALISQNFHFSSADFSTLDAAFRFAISLEKDTLIYIGEVQNIMKDQKAELFEGIKKEERKHLRMLTEYQNRQ